MATARIATVCNSWNRCTRDGGGVNCERIIATGGEERKVYCDDGWAGRMDRFSRERKSCKRFRACCFWDTCIESDVAVSFRNDTFSNFRNLSTVRDKVVDQTFLFNRLRKYISIDARFDAL